jgi:acyl carrier protein
MLTNLGRLWLAGVKVDWKAFHKDERRQRLSLPTYPFERRHYWVSPSPALLNGQSIAQGVEEESGEEDGNGQPEAVQYSRPNLLNEYVAPKTEVERRIADIWQEVLGVEQVGLHDNFYDLGGHSLMGMQLLSRLREAFPLDISVSDFFDALTVEELAKRIEELLVKKVEELPEEEVQRLIAN